MQGCFISYGSWEWIVTLSCMLQGEIPSGRLPCKEYIFESGLFNPAQPIRAFIGTGSGRCRFSLGRFTKEEIQIRLEGENYRGEHLLRGRLKMLT